MSQQKQPELNFIYRNFVIHKDEPLGNGAYGSVYKAHCDELPCAAKILHHLILDPQDPGRERILQRFEQECNVMSGIRHPHIVQFLGLTIDPESRQQVLLMELLDESLTKMLDRFKNPLPYSLEVDLCHDITLAIAYLHTNGIIHRDLSSNNVLIMAGRRAKVTDFGMSKVLNFNSHMTPLTQCPGNDSYMPPEAFGPHPNYTPELDCFSFGVIMIQICTRQWPEPGDRVERVPLESSPTGEVDQPILEVHRRKKHIDMINLGHPLLPIINSCLDYIIQNRPKATELCKMIEALKEEEDYTFSMRSQTYEDNSERNVTLIEQWIRDLQQQRSEMVPLKQKLNHQMPQESTQVEQIKLNWREGRTAPIAMSRMNGSVVVHQKIVYFLIGKSAYSFNTESDTNAWNPLPDLFPVSYGAVIVKDLLTTVGGSNTASMYGDAINEIYSLVEENGSKRWTCLFPPMQTAREGCSALFSENHLIVAGGYTCGNEYIDGYYYDIVEVLDVNTSVWFYASSLPHHFCTASATICGDQIYMLGADKENEEAQRFPNAYLVPQNKWMYSCSVRQLIASRKPHFPKNSIESSIWGISNVPTIHSTCVVVNGQLLALGGCYGNKEATSHVFKYDPFSKSWQLISQMQTARSQCLVAVLPNNELMVVGGKTKLQVIRGTELDSVEYATFIYDQ